MNPTLKARFSRLCRLGRLAPALAAAILWAAVPSPVLSQGATKGQDVYNSASGYALGIVVECVSAGVAAPCPASLVAAVTAAPTVTAASAYASGNAVGGLITLAAINRQSGASIYVQSVTVASKSAQTAQFDLVFFNANPTASTCTDKTAFSVAAADASKLAGVAHVSDWTASAVGSVGQMQQPPIGVPVPVTTLYACLVTRGTPTFTATTDVSVTVFAVQN
jgi:hypothetical protein